MRIGYIVTRLLQIVPTFFFVMVIIFALVRILPGDPTSAIAGERATDEDIARINSQLGLDKPIPVQFLIFVERFFAGDLGNSIVLKVPVMDLVLQRLPVTIALTLFAALLAICLSVPLAFVSALYRDRPIDHGIRTVFQVGLSMPVFYIGLILLTVFAANAGWFPVGGFGDTFLEHLHHLFLPALTLALSLSAILMRNLRSAIIEVLDADFVYFAIAKGLKLRIVLTRHVLRNALISTVTLFGLNLGTLIGGAVITETVFAIPGAGRLMVDSIFGRDYPVIQGLTLAFTILVSLTFLLTDLLQATLDPRLQK